MLTRLRAFHLLRALALTLALLLGAAWAVSASPAPTPALAYTPGRMLDFNGWSVGTFQLANGTFAYCIEPGAIPPDHTQQTPNVVNELRGYSVGMWDATGWSGTVTTQAITGEPLRRINYLLATHGDTQSADTAVAVQFAIWMLRDGAGERAWLDHHISWVEQHGGAAHISSARALVAEAMTTATPPATPTPAPLQLQRGGHPAQGTLAYPAGTTELRLTGATFADGSAVLALDGAMAGTVSWQANLHAQGWQRFHTVQASGTWSLPATGWPAELELYPSAVLNEQTLSWAVGPVTETRVGEWDPVELTIDSQFAPVLRTEVAQRFIPRDEAAFSDTVTFDVAEGSAPWAQQNLPDGSVQAAPVIADGVVYGPFNRPQTPNAVPPVGAPVAGTAQVIADRGPGTYTVSSAQRPDESGYYYWVWSIREHTQAAEIRVSELLPVDYVFSDEFGLVAEGHVTPTRLRWSTTLTSQEMTPHRMEIVDRVTVTLHGGAWLRDDSGARIPARLRLTVYASDAQPQRQATVPEYAREVAHGFVEADIPGKSVISDPIQLPGDTRGWVTVRACLIAADQEPQWRGYIEEWCDDYGIPAETARILSPEMLATTGGASVDTWLLVSLGAVGSGLVLVGLAVLRRVSTRPRR